MEIKLTLGFVAVVDECDSDLAMLKWHAQKRRNKFYASRSNVSMHRVIMERMIGRGLKVGEQVDHKDCDSMNNRRDNLRIATNLENARNASLRKDNVSGFKGVTKQDNKWMARIRVNRKSIYLGYFSTPQEAHEAYCNAATFYFGDFARFK